MKEVLSAGLSRFRVPQDRMDSQDRLFSDAFFQTIVKAFRVLGAPPVENLLRGIIII